MIIAAVAAAAGLLGCVLAVLLLWKKKLSKTWGISLLGLCFGYSWRRRDRGCRQIQNRAEEYGNIYLALCYLERGADRPCRTVFKAG